MVGALTVPALLLGMILGRNHSVTKKPPGSILVLKILGLGSLVIASDALWALKKKYPGSKLILLCGKGVKGGIEPLGLFDEIWESDDSNIFKLIQSGLSCLFKTWRIKNLWVLDLEVYSKLTTVFATITCASNRFGFYLNEVRFRYNLNTHNIYFNPFIYARLNYKSICEAMGAAVTETFYINDYIPSKRPLNFGYIAINNTCSDLSIQRKADGLLLSETCKWILYNTSYKIALCGAPSDHSDNAAFINKYFTLEDRIENKAGQYSLPAYYDFLFNECALMITIDSAPLHIAKRLCLPTISLWGPTNPETLFEADEKNLLHYLHVACSPCVHHTTVLPCGGNNFCMKNMVLESIEPLLRKQLNIALT